MNCGWLTSRRWTPRRWASLMSGSISRAGGDRHEDHVVVLDQIEDVEDLRLQSPVLVEDRDRHVGAERDRCLDEAGTSVGLLLFDVGDVGGRRECREPHDPPTEVQCEVDGVRVQSADVVVERDASEDLHRDVAEARFVESEDVGNHRVVVGLGDDRPVLRIRCVLAPPR